MEMHTKIVVINFIILICISNIDKHLLDDKLEKGSFGLAMGCWVILSFLSIPVWLINFIAYS
jgi:hypothetical protein